MSAHVCLEFGPFSTTHPILVFICLRISLFLHGARLKMQKVMKITWWFWMTTKWKKNHKGVIRFFFFDQVRVSKNDLMKFNMNQSLKPFVNVLLIYQNVYFSHYNRKNINMHILWNGYCVFSCYMMSTSVSLK